MERKQNFKIVEKLKTLDTSELSNFFEVSEEVLSRIKDSFKERKNIAIVGSTGSGKSLLLNALINEIESNEKAACINIVDEYAGNKALTKTKKSDQEGCKKIREMLDAFSLDRVFLDETRREDIELICLTLEKNVSICFTLILGEPHNLGDRVYLLSDSEEKTKMILEKIDLLVFVKRSIEGKGSIEIVNI